jgi:hypothetical protein
VGTLTAQPRSAIPVDPAKLLVIDCLLPGRIIRQGGLSTRMGPSRPARLTATECEIRGGRYVAYDRANYETAFAFWLPQAELGDADAQAYVAEIYEKGLGTAPNHMLAAEWYAKAAAQGHARARLSLAYLYEQGLGVERDPARALNLYRQATGIEDDGLTYVSELTAATDEAERVIASLTAQLEQQGAAVATLQRELQFTRQDLDERRAQLAAVRADTAALQTRLDEASRIASAGREQEVGRLQAELRDKEQQLAYRTQQVADAEAQATARETKLGEQTALIANLEAEQQRYTAQVAEQRELVAAAPATRSIGQPAPVLPTSRMARDLSLGTYHALIIGNNDYEHLPDLDTALNDAQALADVLTERYGFASRVLPNATRGEILGALNDYTKSLKSDDNLLIYYAGHGELDQRNLVGYWLPVNASRTDNTEWISDQMITNLISVMPARHVLVVADSCYSGVMTRGSSLRLVATGGNDAELRRLKKLAQLPSRTVLTSGDTQPVLDGGGGAHSIFAKYLLETLTSNRQVLEGTALYDAVFDPVQTAAAQFRIDQSPRYSVLADAGHLNGEFLFVPAL